MTYTVALMAGDFLALLDELEIASAHVIGHSLGRSRGCGEARDSSSHGTGLRGAGARASPGPLAGRSGPYSAGEDLSTAVGGRRALSKGRSPGRRSRVAGFQVGERASLTKRMGEKDGDAFAELIGAFNPLRVDETFTRQSRFGSGIAHGMFTAGLISAALGHEVPGPRAGRRTGRRPQSTQWRSVGPGGRGR